eukprot:12900149-Prorocentrum_lima.AAC.1
MDVTGGFLQQTLASLHRRMAPLQHQAHRALVLRWMPRAIQPELAHRTSLAGHCPSQARGHNNQEGKDHGHDP